MNSLITIRFARKPSSLQEMKAEINSPDCEVAECEVAETVELTAEEYDVFTRLIYKEWPWLEGRGGDRNGKRQVIAITAPGQETLYANPEGYSYARYIGTAAPTESPIKYPNIHVQLTGNDGNAFMVLGLCQRAAKKGGLSEKEIGEFFNEAQAGDYEHLLNVCMRWFTID
jgi:hypothetical protein